MSNLVDNNQIRVGKLNVYRRKLTDAEKASPMSKEKLMKIEELSKCNVFTLNVYEKKVFNGYLLHKFASHASNIIRYSNEDIPMDTVLGTDMGSKEMVYDAFSDFVNLTVNTLRRLNEIYYSTLDHLDKDLSCANLVIYWHSDWDDTFRWHKGDNDEPFEPVENWGGYICSFRLGDDDDEQFCLDDEYKLFNCTEEEKQNIIKKMQSFYSLYEGNFAYANYDDEDESLDYVYSTHFDKLDERLKIKERGVTYIETAFD